MSVILLSMSHRKAAYANKCNGGGFESSLDKVKKHAHETKNLEQKNSRLFVHQR